MGAFFKNSDPRRTLIGGMELLPSWWSRPYEYQWARQFMDKDAIVADMGAGWSGRPFKEEMAMKCKEVYAVDRDPRFLELPRGAYENLHFIVADFEKEIDGIPPLDIVFCISVLEDLTNYDAAVREFYRLLKPGGMLVITCDSQYDMDKPLPKYPGVSFDKLFNALQDAGFMLPPLNMDKTDAVINTDWNLSCFHMMLIKP